MAVSLDERIQAGKRWVEQTIDHISSEYNIRLENPRWRDDDPDLLLYRLYFDAPGTHDRHFMQFSPAQLVDCPNPDNQETQASIEGYIRDIFHNLTRGRVGH